MDNIIREGEQLMDGGNNNNNNSQGGNYDSRQGGNNDNQQSQQQNSGGGGFMKGFEQNTEDSYVNQEANSFLSKEGVPTAMDGAIDGALDTEVNKYAKDL